MPQATLSAMPRAVRSARKPCPVDRLSSMTQTRPKGASTQKLELRRSSSSYRRCGSQSVPSRSIGQSHRFEIGLVSRYCASSKTLSHILAWTADLYAILHWRVSLRSLCRSDRSDVALKQTTTGNLVGKLLFAEQQAENSQSRLL